MIPGIIPKLEIGELGLEEPDDELEFPILIDQWTMVAGLMKEARGEVISKVKRVKPLWLVLRNETQNAIASLWATYRIHLKNGINEDAAMIKGDVAFPVIAAGGEARVALFDMDVWSQVKADVVSVTSERSEEVIPNEGPSEASLNHEVAPRDLCAVVYCPTGASFTEVAQVTFQIPNENATVRFRQPSPRESLCVTKHHNLPGLIAIVEMPNREGDLLAHAFKAQTICDGLLSSAFALTLADVREAFPVLICDATKGLQERSFIHFYADRLVMGRRAQLSPKEWSDKASSIYGSSSKRVIRAIRWLRKMHTEDDILDRFLAGWTGLETLNPELCEYFNVPKSGEDVRRCGKCGENLVRDVPRANGLKELFLREGKEAVYKACSPARNGLVHGFQDLGELNAIAREHTAIVGFLLAKGIEHLSGLPISSDFDKFKWLNGFRIASNLFFEGSLSCGEISDYEYQYNELPLFDFSMTHQGGVVEGKTVLESEAKFTPPPGCTVSLTRLGVSGPVTVTNLKATHQATNP